MKHSNRELKLAEEYIRETGSNLFLTGKAGTGKTTFLQTLRKNCAKRLIVTAPTGVAAINAGGVTLHSFFQLPFGPIIPGGERERPTSHYRFSKVKINIIRSLDLLVIDEISMVRADLLDGVDSTLRRFRNNSQPFGGIQLLMIGDLHQLPPVVKNEEWKLLHRFYDSPFFFSSKALADTELVSIELKQIFRQEDDSFIEVLNQVRENNLSPLSLQKINARVKTGFSPDDCANYITLCSHNHSADLINQKMIDRLSQRLHSYEAEVEGNFPEHTFPASSTLELKKGAQVMFIRNDSTPDKRYFNGKIGIITHISKSTVLVKCPEDTEEIEVEPALWENIEYSLNQETLEVTETKIGSFRQYPLRYAWAITIHKSQGLTFDNAVIDAQAAFAHGQVYVALSRCRTLEGLILTAPLSLDSLKTDASVLHFTRKSSRDIPSATNLEQAKIAYQQRLIFECFAFNRLRSLLRRTVSLVLGNQSIIHVTGIKNLSEVQQAAEESIFAIGTNFQRQLNTLFRSDILPTNDTTILERLAKASVYFSEKLNTLLISQIDTMQLETDNKELRRKVNRSQQMLEEEMRIKLAAVQSCTAGFSSTHYLRAITAATVEIQKPRKKTQPTYTESDIAHPDLFLKLKEWRGRKANEEDLAHFQVMHQKALVQVAIYLPENLIELKKLKGIGDKLAKRYGNELIAIVVDFKKEHNIEAVVLPTVSQQKISATPKPQEKVDTRKVTLELFTAGMSIKEIAEKRSLTRNTIENHIARHIEEGNISAHSLFSPERFTQLLPQVEKKKGKKLKEIKEGIDADISYGEIHFLLAHLKNTVTSHT